MHSPSIRCSVIIALCVGGFAFGQGKTTSSAGPETFLKQCSNNNPPPCADKPPILNYAPAPSCSKEAEKAKIGGTVVLAVVVGTDGTAHEVSVVKSLGYGLDEEAITSVKKWRFKPGKGSGGPAPVQIRVKMEFRCTKW